MQRRKRPCASGLLALSWVLVLSLHAVSGWAQQLEDYKLHPGDQLEVSVWKEPDMQRTTIVRPDGKITFPLVNEVLAAGRTVAQVRTDLENKLKPYIPEPVVTVTVTGIEGNKIYVIGQVNKPGAYVMNPQITVVQALSLAGGVTAFAAKGDIKVIRGTQPQRVIPFAYDEVLKGRSLDQNVLLEGGDVIVVP